MIFDPKTEQTLRILTIGDVVGRAGRRLLKRALPALKQACAYDGVVVNVENAAGGFGLTWDVYREFVAMDVDCMTSGNHIFDKKDYAAWFHKADLLLRPINFPPGSAGKGQDVFELPGGDKIAVVNAIGRTFMKSYDCPFRALDAALPELAETTPITLLDFHAEATSEKTAMGWYAAERRASAVWGTHTHVPTADARILDGYTGYQTDLGMTGPYDSVIGMEKNEVIKGFLTLGKTRFEVAKKDARLGGCLFDFDRRTGGCLHARGLFLSEDDLARIERAAA